MASGRASASPQAFTRAGQAAETNSRVLALAFFSWGLKTVSCKKGAEVQTTDDRLAQRIGRTLMQANKEDPSCKRVDRDKAGPGDARWPKAKQDSQDGKRQCEITDQTGL